MLNELRIQNFAIADNLQLSFGDGLNVITGETGSGKSLVVNAFSLLLGRKADTSLVRDGEKSAVVEGIFHWRPPASVAELLLEAGAPLEEDDTLILSREIFAGGRSVCRINSRAVPVSLLREVGGALADIHGQHQHQALLRVADHTFFLDVLGPVRHTDAIEKYRRTRSELAALLKNRDEIETGRARREEECDMLQFRISEIENAIDSEESFLAIQDEEKRLEHAAELSEAAGEAWRLLARSGRDDSALNRTAAAVGHLLRVEGLDETIDSARSLIEEAEALLENAAGSLRTMAEEMRADPQRLLQLQDTVLEVKALIRKNRCEDVASLLEFRDNAKDRIHELEKMGESAGELDSEIKEKRATLKTLADEISKERKKIAARVEKQMKTELKQLAMPGAVFEVALEQSEEEGSLPPRNGAETVEFLVSANQGEEPRPLAKIASGGELSRVMLAFKSILSRHDPVAILVFDEIDAGIGGVTANSIGEKLCALADHRQILTVTHLPQVAAMGGSHISVHKKKSGGRTVARAEVVEGEDRQREISRMLGDAGEKDTSMKLASELLNGSGKKPAKGKKARA